MSALDGLRVLDLSSGPAAGLATMVLADFGADVAAVRPMGSHPLDELPSARLWMRGKTRVQLNLNETQDRAAFDALLADADVFVTNWRPQALQARHLDPTTVRARHPQLVYCLVSGFGKDSPLANCAAYEHVVAARSGRMMGFAGLTDRAGPVFSALHVAVHASSQSALAGILAALLQREQSGCGRLVDVSLLKALLAYEQGMVLARQYHQVAPDVVPAFPPLSEIPPLPSLFYHPAQAGDGRWMQFGNLLPHLFDNFLLTTELMDVLADPDFDHKQLSLPREKHEAFRERMLKRIQDRTSGDWMRDFIADGGVVATTYQTTQQALDDPDIEANGHVVQVASEERQLGPLARLAKTPAEVRAAETGDAGSVLQRWRARPAVTPKGEPQALPLAGIKVVEIATIIAAPMSAALLADLGAEVTKVEQIGGDPYRGFSFGAGSARVNAGKRSISVNLKSEEGRQLVQRLLSQADVLIHNYRPGVPEKLGIGYETIAELNPRLIYVQSNGYGPDGPGAQRPSTHPIPGAAMGGVLYQMGERLPTELQDVEGLRLWTSRLMRANEVNPDPNTALVIASSVLLALSARARSGEGQQVKVDMFGANAYANYDDFFSYPGKPPRQQPDERLQGLSPTYRLYECADRSWLFCALVTERERNVFAEALREEGLGEVPDWQDAAATERALGALFAQQHADWWEARLTVHNLGCVRADGVAPSDFWLDDALADGCMGAAHHPRFGDYVRHGRLASFDGDPPALGSPPLAGQHAHEIAAELGYDEAEVDAFLASGVLWQEKD